MRQDASTHTRFDIGTVATVLEAVLCSRRRHAHADKAPWLVGLSGLQGSGKSTFAIQLRTAADQVGVPSQVLSLDDFYLGRRDRARLAKTTHPLLRTRGVPGTHDIPLLTRVLGEMARASERHPAHVPQFDKGRDTRLPPSRWRRVVVPPKLVVLEGWCVGVPPQEADALADPLNALERLEDRDGIWRAWVNRQLADVYAPLWQRIDQLILLQAPDFGVVAGWRGQQEREQWARHAPHAMDADALQRFLMHYERLSRHALQELPHRADLCLRLGPDRQVTGIDIKP